MTGNDPLIGTDIGRYRITRTLGTGGMGTVYLAEQAAIGSRVAVKVLSDQCARIPDLLERFFAEAKAVNLIKHENIVSVLDLAQLADGRPYIVMEFVDGPTLGDVVRGDQRAPLGGVVRALIEVLSALEAAHAIGIVHRDLKPDNVLVTGEGHAKVLDFGIAKLAPGLSNQLSPRTRTGALLGTPAYMAPEQISGAKEIDARADVYAAGALLFEAVTGRVPYEGTQLFDLMRAHLEAPIPSARTFRPDVPPELDAVIARALAKAPGDRFPSAGAMADAIDAASRSIPDHEWRPLAARGRSSKPDMIRPSLARMSRASNAPPVNVTPSNLPQQGPPQYTPSGHAHGFDATQPASLALQPPPRAARPSAQPPLAEAPVVAPVAAPPAKSRAPLIFVIAVVLAAAAIGVALYVRKDTKVVVVETPQDLAVPTPPEPIAPSKIEPAGSATTVTGSAGSSVAKAPVLPPIKTTVVEPSVTKQGNVTIIQTGGTTLSIAPDFDPKHFDPLAYLPKARALAQKLLPDAEFTEFEMYENVRPNGHVDLTIPSDHDSYFEFRSPSKSQRPADLPRNTPVDIPCRVNVEVHATKVEATIVTSEKCDEPIRKPPRCSLATIWKQAAAEGVATDNVVATIGFLHDGTWFFDLSDDVHSYQDCK